MTTLRLAATYRDDHAIGRNRWTSAVHLTGQGIDATAVLNDDGAVYETTGDRDGLTDEQIAEIVEGAVCERNGAVWRTAWVAYADGRVEQVECETARAA